MPRANFETGLKVCSKCGTEQPIENFGYHARAKDKLDGVCPACKREYYHRLKSADPAAYNEKQKARRWLRPDYFIRERARTAAYRARPEIIARVRERHAKYRAENKEKIRIQQAEYRRTHPGLMLKLARQRKYGASPETMKSLERRQNGKCAGCYTPLSGLSERKIHVDHCHATGKVRGLLCFSCNTGMGQLKDNSTTLRRLADYLDSHAIKIIT
jgi:recombination endonuclease VII